MPHSLLKIENNSSLYSAIAKQSFEKALDICLDEQQIDWNTVELHSFELTPPDQEEFRAMLESITGALLCDLRDEDLITLVEVVLAMPEKAPRIVLKKPLEPNETQKTLVNELKNMGVDVVDNLNNYFPIVEKMLGVETQE